MANDKGSAVAIVMLVLGVASLIGVALLHQTRLDIQVTSAVTSYNKLFSLADGGSAIAFKDLRDYNREFTYTEGEEKYRFVYPAATSWNEDVAYQKLVEGGYSKPISYSAIIRLRGFTTDPTETPGWDISEYYPEFWVGEGVSGQDTLFGGTSSTVHSAVTKFKKKF